MAEPKPSDSLICQTIVAKQQLEAHRKTLNKEINGRIRRFNTTVDSLARSTLGGTELFAGLDTESMNAELKQLIADPTRGL